MRLFAEFHHSGDHEGAWRLPTARPDRTADAAYYVERARIARRGGFSHVFAADFPGYDPSVRHQVRWPFEPSTLLGALAAAVPGLGVVATASTVFASAEELVDTFATLQDVSGGRAGWNIVTSGSPAASAAFGRTLPAHDDRYDAADAVVDAVRAAFTEETRPLFVQAGASPRGRAFAARHADVVFAATPDRDAARTFRDDLHARADALGRRPPQLLPGFLVTLGSTATEARRRREELDDLLGDGTLATLLHQFGLDLPGVGLDDPLPDLVAAGEGHDGIRSRSAVLDGVARRLGPGVTLRRLVRHIAGSRGHLQHTGTPDEVARVMEDWVHAGAADGFVVKFSHNPGGAEDFVDGVTPLLRARGLLHEEHLT